MWTTVLLGRGRGLEIALLLSFMELSMKFMMPFGSVFKSFSFCLAGFGEVAALIFGAQAQYLVGSIFVLQYILPVIVLCTFFFFRTIYGENIGRQLAVITGVLRDYLVLTGYEFQLRLLLAMPTQLTRAIFVTTDTILLWLQ